MNGMKRMAAITALWPLEAGAALAAAGGPFGVAPFGPGLAPGGGGGPVSLLLGWIAARQSELYQALTYAVAALKTDGSAAVLLVSVSFAYGVFHALGPGHGKAVISSYLLAEEAGLRRGIALSFAAALLQASVAVALISVAAILLNLTSLAISKTMRVLEIGSALLVIGLGLHLLWGKVVRPARDHLRRQRAAPVSRILFASAPRPLGAPAVAASFSADDGCCPDPACGCGLPHIVDPGRLARPLRLRGAAAVAFVVGLRPCTGALIILVFALSQDLYAAGIAATYAMAVGTAATVAVIAVITVAAREKASRLASRRPGRPTIMQRVLEGLGAIAILLLGGLLLSAALPH